MMKLEVQWIVGFVDGEGCFLIVISPNSTYKVGFKILLEFVVVQNKRDIKLLYNIKSFFGCGVVRKISDNSMCYRVCNIEHLATIIVPFFERHCLKTMKRIDFLKFRKVIRLVLDKKHLTLEGLEQIKNIKAKEFKIESSSLR